MSTKIETLSNEKLADATGGWGYRAWRRAEYFAGGPPPWAYPAWGPRRTVVETRYGW